MSSFTAWCPRSVASLGQPTTECLGCFVPAEGWVHGEVGALDSHVQEPISPRDSRQDACPAGVRTAVAKDTLGRKDMMSNETSQRNVRDKMGVEFAVRNVVSQGKSLW